MRLTRLAIWTGTLLTVSVFAIGCADDKKTIESLQAQNKDLLAKNKSLEADLDAAREHEIALQNDLAAKDQQLAAMRQGAGKVEAPVGKPAAAGWEKGLYGDRVTLATDILFKSGEAKLTEAGRHRLDEVAATLKSTYKGLPVRVYGYTDNDPIFRTRKLWDDNLDLSANRAMAVTRYLWGKGLAKEYVETVAMGETHFLASNASKTTKAKNRRVEIIVLKK